MTWAIGIPSISAPQALRLTVEAVQKQDVETDIVIVQNGRAVADECNALEDMSENVTIIRPNFNMGCSASWNFACRWAWGRKYDKIMLLNDDFIIKDPSGLSKIDAAIEEDPNAHYHFQGFTSVCIRRALWNLVGEFDEGFWPAYFEDNDYYQRSVALGIDWKIVEIEKEHFNSLSLRSSAMLNILNSRTFGMNRERYIHKWGGVPHSETFTQPWNGQAPTYGNVRELMAASGWEDWYF